MSGARTGLVILVSGCAAVSRALALTLASKTPGVVIVDHVEGEPLRDVEPPALDLGALERGPLRFERTKPIPAEAFKVYAERADDRRNDPQRDVAMLRREMLARERSNRHMLKKGRGRR
jgi:hypothetical protein